MIESLKHKLSNLLTLCVLCIGGDPVRWAAELLLTLSVLCRWWPSMVSGWAWRRRRNSWGTAAAQNLMSQYLYILLLLYIRFLHLSNHGKIRCHDYNTLKLILMVCGLPHSTVLLHFFIHFLKTVNLLLIYSFHFVVRVNFVPWKLTEHSMCFSIAGHVYIFLFLTRQLMLC